MSNKKLEDIIDGQSFPANNRYLLFSGSPYYPQGGWADLVFSSNILDEVVNKAVNAKDDWFQIVDVLQNRILIDSGEIREEYLNLKKEIINNKIISSNAA